MFERAQERKDPKHIENWWKSEFRSHI